MITNQAHPQTKCISEKQYSNLANGFVHEDIHWITLLTQHFSNSHFSITVRDIDFSLQTMMFKFIHDTFILKALIHNDLLHHGMPRVRFQHAARANGIQ